MGRVKTEEDPTRQAVSGQTEPEASDSNDVANSTGSSGPRTVHPAMPVDASPPQTIAVE